MTYPREHGVTFTEMCIYIDDNIYKEDADEEKCFKYIYHIFYTLATKYRFFNTEKDYDEYALYAAARLFMRYHKKDLKVIKSVLNYVKTVLYPIKVEYQAQTFNQVFKQDVEEEVAKNLQASLTSQAYSQNDSLMRTDFSEYINQIPRTIKEHLKNSPYYNDKIVIKNIYISCLLTILNRVTLDSENLIRLEQKYERKLPADELLESIYDKQRDNKVILYHIDASMSNYIDTLVKQIYKIISKDLVYIISSFQPSEDIIQSILFSPVDDIQEVFD